MRFIDDGARGAEVMVLFEDSVLAVHSLGRGARFCVGDGAGVDLPLAGLGDGVDLARVTAAGGVEIVTPAHGTVQVELADDPRGELTWTRELPGDLRVALLPPGARGCFAFGAVSVVVTEGALPRRTPLPPRLDLRAHSTTALVAMIFAVCVLGAHAIPPTGMSLAVDPFALQGRNALISLVPPVVPPSGGGKVAGQGEQAAAAPLRRVHVTARPPGAPTVRPKPAVNAGAAGTKTLAQDAVATSAAISVLGSYSGSQVAAIFSQGSALSDAGRGVLDELSGSQLGEGSCDGVGCGTALVGSGRIADGVATIGLDKIGRPGGGGGHGFSGGAGALGGRRAGSPEILGQPDVLVGDGNKDVIRRVVRSHMAELRFCYEKELLHDDKLAGRVVTRFTLSPDGRVVAAMTASSTMSSREVDACIAASFRRFEFPKMSNAKGVAIVSYPLSFQMAGH